jgi:hypothetical protein
MLRHRGEKDNARGPRTHSTPKNKKPADRGGFLTKSKQNATDYFSASNARSRISSTLPRPEIRRYCGAFNEVVVSPFFAQPL